MDWQFRRAEALRAALNEILRIADRYASAREGTYHNAVMEIFGVTCRALNADADTGRAGIGIPRPEGPRDVEMGPHYEPVIIRPTEERS